MLGITSEITKIIEVKGSVLTVCLAAVQIYRLKAEMD